MQPAHTRATSLTGRLASPAHKSSYRYSSLRSSSLDHSAIDTRRVLGDALRDMDRSETEEPQRAIASIDEVDAGLEAAGYIASRRISTAIYIAHHLRKPILVEGPAGVGKTELAKSVASWLMLPLIRIQCYEGLDEAKALYEWKYGKQLLYTQILRDKVGSLIGEEEDLRSAIERLHSFGDVFFSKRFLEPRPLLRA